MDNILVTVNNRNNVQNYTIFIHSTGLFYLFNRLTILFQIYCTVINVKRLKVLACCQVPAFWYENNYISFYTTFLLYVYGLLIKNYPRRY